MSSGAELFARYAYPPNALGYCGPDGEGSALALGATGGETEQVRGLARAFDGAWPYLELIASAAGAADPLDGAVVEAYWIGGPPLDRVEPEAFARRLTESFGGQPGIDWNLVHALVEAGAVPHHSFHVLAVYPWLGLLRSGHEDRPLEVLDRCRIRWGSVVAARGDTATVRCSPLIWDGKALGLGEPKDERADTSIEGHAIVPGLAPGDVVALHWNRVCGRVDDRQIDRLRATTLRHLDLVNGV